MDGHRIVAREVPAVAFPLSDVLEALLDDPGSRMPAWRRAPQTLGCWVDAARLAVALVRGQLVAPDLVEHGGQIHGVWRALVDDHPMSRAALDRIAGALPPAGHALLLDDERTWAPGPLLEAFVSAVADLCARRGAEPPPAGRPRARLLPWTSRWREALADPVDSIVPLGDDAGELAAGIAAWHARDDGPEGAHTEVTLVPPHDADGPWRLDLAVRVEGGPLVDAAAVWAGETRDADPFALQETLMRGLGRCARIFPPLEQAMSEREPEALELDLHQAWEFLSAAAPLLVGSDVVAVLPDELTEQQLGLRLRLTDAQEGSEERPSEDEAALRGEGLFESEMRSEWEVVLAGERIGDEELDRLLSTGTPLVRWRDRWVHVDPGVTGYLDQVRDGTLPAADALLLGLAGSVPLSQLTGAEATASEPVVEVAVEGALGALLDQLGEATALPELPTPEGFSGELRPYQRRGVAWLGGMAALGLGGVLADEMGLGKTIQLIAHLLHRSEKAAHLVVCPTSVVGNWEREIARFAPGLPVTRFHGPERPERLDGVTGVVVTSYGILRRESERLAEVDWDVVTLDEAQHIKNPRTAGARAARELRSAQTVVLTGTPLENRLGELWALIDVTNRGLLGSRARFGRRFVTPVERRGDPQAASRLRRVVAPFVLRRRKSDPAVVSDLPDKIERTVPCALTPEQAALYQKTVDAVLRGDGLAQTSAMERRGRILALLTALKQICNHPAHYLGESDPAMLGRSGKLAAAREILAEVTSAGEQALVFTQYVKMGHLLVAQLTSDLGAPVDFLHGGVPAGRRDRMVEAFQDRRSAPVLVVSLRAGGTGLNLTAATHVVHYDRWWNPAVEDQATDRTHRIGQERTVEVHKLVTAGTVEERIAEVLERKRALAEQVVGEGEQWITELGDDELAELVALSSSGEELDDELGPDDDRWGSGDLEEAS